MLNLKRFLECRRDGHSWGDWLEEERPVVPIGTSLSIWMVPPLPLEKYTRRVRYCVNCPKRQYANLR